MEWVEPLGREGRIEVEELVRYDELGRRTTAEPTREIVLATTEVAGHTVACAATGRHRTMSVDGAVVAVLDLERRPEVEGGGWAKPVGLDGSSATVEVRSDASAGSRLRGPLRYLHVDGAGRSWTWHFVGGTLAGERLVLVRGDAPGGPAVVSTHPAGQGRSLGNPRGGAGPGTHVTSWTAEASLGEVVLAELLVTAKLDGLVDYRAARLAEGVQELTGYVPRVEANTE
ncbi:MAG TPA: hypothetical protein VF416_07275 [Marmoricola sp.]